MESLKTKVLIIGSGPAGYTAAIYASRANLNPIVFEGAQPGGQLTTTTEIENFPGYPEGINGFDMMDQLKTQAERFGTVVYPNVITKINLEQRPFTAEADNGQIIVAETVIIATGASAKYLGLADEVTFRGKGVSACATCDGFFYRGKTVAVVGGGDTACEEALYLSTLAKDVYMIVRRDVLRASKVMQKRVAETPNIHLLYNTQTEGLSGDGMLRQARLVRFKGTPEEAHTELPIDGFFLAIGHTPNTSLFTPLIETDETGYIKTKGTTTETNIKGVFAAGDVADPRYRQAITAAGMGCKAAIDAERFLKEV